MLRFLLRLLLSALLLLHRLLLALLRLLLLLHGRLLPALDVLLLGLLLRALLLLEGCLLAAQRILLRLQLIALWLLNRSLLTLLCLLLGLLLLLLQGRLLASLSVLLLKRLLRARLSLDGFLLAALGVLLLGFLLPALEVGLLCPLLLRLLLTLHGTLLFEWRLSLRLLSALAGLLLGIAPFARTEGLHGVRRTRHAVVARRLPERFAGPSGLWRGGRAARVDPVDLGLPRTLTGRLLSRRFRCTRSTARCAPVELGRGRHRPPFGGHHAECGLGGAGHMRRRRRAARRLDTSRPNHSRCARS
ncbi:MAG: hypothetical protein WDN30_05700 [Pararobbsia sp.]